MDDRGYMSFLKHANLYEQVEPAAARWAQTKAVDTAAPVPTVLQDLRQRYYTSDTDEPFEPVSLSWKGDGFPSADELKALILNHGYLEVETLSVEEFDSKQQYSDVIEAVRKSGGDGEEVKIFRITHSSTRAEYYVVSLDVKCSRLVGVRAKAVES